MFNPKSLKNLQHKGRGYNHPNKFTNLKEAFIQAFNGLSDENKLGVWAIKKKNLKDFFGMMAKMLPHTVDTNVNVPKQIVLMLHKDKNKKQEEVDKDGS